MKKCIKNYSTDITTKKLNIIKEYLHNYNKCKNLFYNLYQNRPDIVFLPYKFELRDRLVKSIKENSLDANQIVLLSRVPAKMWKCALQEAISDLKAIWTTRKKMISYKISFNENLHQRDKNYLFYLLNSNNLLNCLIKGKIFNINEHLDVNHQMLNSQLLRTLKCYPIKKPFANGNSYFIDGSSQLTYFKVKETLFASISTSSKRAKVNIKLTDNTLKLDGNVRVVVKNNRIELHKVIDIVENKNTNVYKKCIVDIGLVDLIRTESNVYGQHMNILINKYKHGIVSQNVIEDFINKSISNFIKTEKPTTISVRDMDKRFLTISGIKLNSELISKLKRFIKERFTYKLRLNSIELVFVNNAYTDKVCSCCGSFETVIYNSNLQCKQCSSSTEIFKNTIANIKTIERLGVSTNTP